MMHESKVQSPKSREFYMTRPEETAKQPDALTMFELIACASAKAEDGADVFNALWSFWNFAHALDDLIDADEDQGSRFKVLAEDKERVLRTAFEFVGGMLIHPQDAAPGLAMRREFEKLLADSGWDLQRQKLALDALLDFTGNLLANPFYTTHAREHQAMFDMIIARTLDADDMERTRPHLKALLPAIRCGDVDFIVHCAKLAGGWELMRKVGKLRDYDVEVQSPKSQVQSPAAV